MSSRATVGAFAAAAVVACSAQGGGAATALPTNRATPVPGAAGYLVVLHGPGQVIDNTLAAVDVATRRVHELGVGGGLDGVVDVPLDARAALIRLSGRAGALAVVVESGAATATASAVVAVSPDGTRALAACGAQLCVGSLARGRFARVAGVPLFASGVDSLAWLPGRGWLVVTSSDLSGQTYPAAQVKVDVVDATTGAVAPVGVLQRATRIVASADGRTMAWYSAVAGGVVVAPVEQPAAPRPLGGHDDYVHDCAFADTDRTLVCVRGASHGALVAFDVATARSRVLDDDVVDYSPVPSPDGRFVAYSTSRVLRVVAVDGSTPPREILGTDEPLALAWLP